MKVISLPADRRPLSLTPLIDVVFILIVFFMLVTRFDDPRRLRLNTLPAHGVASASATSTVLYISAERLRLDDRELTLEQLRDAFNRLSLNPESNLHIRVAPKTPLQSLVSPLDLAAQAGINRVAVTPGTAQPSP